MSTSFFVEQDTPSDYKYNTYNNMTLDLNSFIDLDIFSINTPSAYIIENTILNNVQYNIQQTPTEPILAATLLTSLLYKKKGKMKEICSMYRCTFSQFKHNLCRIHYYKENNLTCSVNHCNNLKRKFNLCYKHVKPICSIKYCKCYALLTDSLCKKHKQNNINNSQKNIIFL